MRPAPLAVALASCGLAVAACGSSSTSSSNTSSSSTTTTSSTPACVSGSITASGSTALQPLAQNASQAYSAKCPGATVTVSGGGSSTGLANVAAGTSDIGDSDVPVSNAKSIDASTLTDHQVAIVVFGIIVNPKTNVTALTTKQAQDVFSGKVTNWSAVGGANVPVSLVERKPGSGTRLSFDKIIMQGQQESATPASTQDSTQLALQQVAASAGGVSYLSAASADPTVTVVTLDGAPADSTDVQSGKYKFFAHEHMYTKTTAAPLATAFIDFILSSEFQNQLPKGFLPVATTKEQSAADQ